MTYSGSFCELVANLKSTFGFLPPLGEAHKSLLKSFEKIKCCSFEWTKRKREEFGRKIGHLWYLFSLFPNFRVFFTKHTLHCKEALHLPHVWPLENTYSPVWLITCPQLSTTSFQRSWASQVWNSSVTTTSCLTYFEAGVGGALSFATLFLSSQVLLLPVLNFS